MKQKRLPKTFAEEMEAHLVGVIRELITEEEQAEHNSRFQQKEGASRTSLRAGKAVQRDGR